MKKNEVILVDKNDNQLGTMEKMKAHREAVLHRAISVFIFNTNGDWLLQQRTKTKYHSNSLWSNTCCTHPFPGESNLDAANRRLKEEMGIQCELKKVFDFIYREPMDGDLTEHELDHVFIGITDSKPVINKMEVMNYRYIDYHELSLEMERKPENYTSWFKIIAERVNTHFQQK